MALIKQYLPQCDEVYTWSLDSDTTNIDQSVAEWLKNVVEGAEATGQPLEHVFYEEGDVTLLCAYAVQTRLPLMHTLR